MDRKAVKSTFLKSVGYDPEKHRMELEFCDGDCFCYNNIPPRLHKDLMESDSLGKFFLKKVKPFHEGKRI